jgi:SAM-dependent methyltransferase
MVNLLFIHDDELLATPGTVRKLLDPTCGTGGMLAEAQKYLHQHHAQAGLYVYGQDYNKRSFAVAASDLLIKTDAKENQKSEVRYGDSLVSDPDKGDQFPADKFDYLLANPPFGVDWKKQAKEIEDEHGKLRFCRTLRRGTAASERRLAPVSPAHDQQVRAGVAGEAKARLAARHRVSTARRCSPVARAAARATSANGSLKTTGSKPSSRCRSRCFTIPASALTSGL